MRIVHGSHDGRREAEPHSGDWLEVRRGRTRFPRRPLSSDRFLIGSGTNCHLQLGGDMPMLHSLLVQEEGRWTVEVIAPEPMLFVNGEACRQRVLCVGDCIQIGEFEFALCRGEGGRTEPAPRHPHHRAVTSASVTEEAAELTASELLERVEVEVVAVVEFEAGRRRGAKALLDAIFVQGDRKVA